MRWLNKKEKIPAKVMRGRGMGAKEPIAHNTKPDGSDDPAGRAQEPAGGDSFGVRLFLAKVQRRHLTSRSRRWCGGEMVAGGLPAR